jgi:uncharacterized membrane protein YdjX (TVP38/TMEM64 family)
VTPDLLTGLWIGTVFGVSAGVFITLLAVFAAAVGSWRFMRPHLANWLCKALP